MYVIKEDKVMNKKMNTLVTAITLFGCLLIVLINGLTGDYAKYDILAGIFSALALNGIYYTVCSIIKKSNVTLIGGVISLLIGAEGLLIKYGVFGDMIWAYFLIPVLVIAFALIIRSLSGNVSAYTADNEKPGYKSYRERQAEKEEK